MANENQAPQSIEEMDLTEDQINEAEIKDFIDEVNNIIMEEEISIGNLYTAFTFLMGEVMSEIEDEDFEEALSDLTENIRAIRTDLTKESDQ